MFRTVVVCVCVQYGEIEEMNVCDNLGDHLVGNIYVKVNYIKELYNYTVCTCSVDDITIIMTALSLCVCVCSNKGTQITEHRATPDIPEIAAKCIERHCFA